MPHFSPMSWLLALLIFYLILFSFFIVVWWIQNYKFTNNLMLSSGSLLNFWLWD